MQNPYFVGWGAIASVWNAVLSKAGSAGLVIHEFDVNNELDVLNTTVHLRTITDNKHTDTGNGNSLDVVGYYLSYYGFDPTKATASVVAEEVTSAGFDCGSWYGDSARVIEISSITSAIAGGLVGLPSGYTASQGLDCGGTPASDAVSQPRGYTLPTLLDFHDYNIISGADAATTFSDVWGFIASFGPSGWRGYNPNVFGAEAMVGETHSNTVDASNPSKSCEGFQNPSQLPFYEINGFNSSQLANTNLVVFRPWGNLLNSCYPLHPQVNPPYSTQP